MNTEPSPDDKQHIVLGKLNAHHGIKGWLKVFSYTDPKQNILSYKKVMLFREGQKSCWKEVEIINGRPQGKGIVVQIKGYDSRETSEQLIGSNIVVTREDLKKLPEDDYYWIDLMGLKVINQQGIVLGNIASMMATAANDVMIVKHREKPAGIQEEYLIPYIPGQYVLKVDLKAAEIQVDWDADF